MSWKIIKNEHQSFDAIGIRGEGLGQACDWCKKLVLAADTPFVTDGQARVYHLRCAWSAVSKLIEELQQFDKQLMDFELKNF